MKALKNWPRTSDNFLPLPSRTWRTALETQEDLALQHFTDCVQDPETQKALRLADVKDIASALVYAHKIKAAQQASRKDRHMIRGVSASDPKTDF